MTFTCAELFAKRGDEWNSPNFQVSAGLRVKRIPDFHGGGRVLVDEVEGYEPNYQPPRKAEPKPQWVDPPRPQVDQSARRACNEAMRLKQVLKRVFK